MQNHNVPRHEDDADEGGEGSQWRVGSCSRADEEQHVEDREK